MLTYHYTLSVTDIPRQFCSSQLGILQNIQVAILRQGSVEKGPRYRCRCYHLLVGELKQVSEPSVM